MRACARSCDIASSDGFVWQGVMGAARQPALLLRDTVNLESSGDARSERLTSGRYKPLGTLIQAPLLMPQGL
jgi:hypothetical protein